MSYVDGYVLPVPRNKLDAYKKMALVGGEIWMKHGALAYYECAGDDLTPDMPEMKIKTFLEIADAGADDTVIFAFIIFKSREHRDEVNKKVMADPAMTNPDFDPNDMPFDPTKMAFGGFTPIVEYGN